MTSRRLLLPVLTLSLMPVATAAAADKGLLDQSSGAPTTGAATSAPAAVEKQPAELTMTASGVGRTGTVLVGQSIRLRGVIKPYVPGQKVTLKIDQAGRQVLVKARSPKKVGGGAAGIFLLNYKPTGTGTLHIGASHLTTARQAAAKAKTVSVDVLPRSVDSGSAGRQIRILQRRLKALGYVVDDNGSFDGHTYRAIVAFRKLTGMDRTGIANKAFFEKLASGAGAFKVKFPSHGRHIEGDLTHQVMALIGKGGKVERIYPISSGKPSTPTVLGTFRVYRKDFGTNAKGMVHSSYFYNGYAIHGYAEVPVYAASHGCLRTPVPDARSIFRWVDYGTIVDVYYR